MLEPWAPISQRLRRKFQTASLPALKKALIALRNGLEPALLALDVRSHELFV